MKQKLKALPGGRRDRAEERTCLKRTLSITPVPGSYDWRKARGLLTLSDHNRRYRFVRHPRGDYETPMPEDLIEACA